MTLSPYYSNPGSANGNESGFSPVIQLHVLLTNYHNETDIQADRDRQTDIYLLVIKGLVARVVVGGGGGC